MSETKFTPGPWHVDGLGNVWSVNTKIAEVSDLPKMSMHYRVPTRRERAAVRCLIASAPDMYGDLDTISVELDLLRQAIEAGDPKAELLIRVEDMQKRNRKVLAKARGEEPK